MVTLVVRAKKSATPDQQGEITFTVTDRDGGSATHHSSVSIGEGVDLAAIEQGLQLTGALGGTLDVPLTVANRGEKTVHDVVLYFEGGYGFGPSKRYKNCEYSPTDAFRHAFACRFPNTIEPGGAARLDSSFGFTVRPTIRPRTVTPARRAGTRRQTGRSSSPSTQRDLGSRAPRGSSGLSRSVCKAGRGRQTSTTRTAVR